GRTDGPALTLTSRLWVNDSIVIVAKAIVWCGSRPTGSSWTAILKIPPRFGPWASATGGASRPRTRSVVPAASAAPPRVSRSRRVTGMGMGSQSSQRPSGNRPNSASQRDGELLEASQRRRLAPLQRRRGQLEVRGPLDQGADGHLSFQAS